MIENEPSYCLLAKTAEQWVEACIVDEHHLVCDQFHRSPETDKLVLLEPYHFSVVLVTLDPVFRMSRQPIVTIVTQRGSNIKPGDVKRF